MSDDINILTVWILHVSSKKSNVLSTQRIIQKFSQPLDFGRIILEKNIYL